MIRYLIILLLLPLSITAQIKEKHIRDFSGGLVNGISNAFMQDNQALQLVNYNITADKDNRFGSLKRRGGFSQHYTDGNMGDGFAKLIPFYTPTTKKLLNLRLRTDYHPKDSIGAAVMLLTLCDDALLSCSTIVYDGGFYNWARNYDRPYNASYFTQNNNTFITTAEGELVFYNGTEIVPARPLASGQARIAIIDSGNGLLNGTYRYSYLFSDKDTIENDISDLAPPTWWVTVTNGSAAIMSMDIVEESSRSIDSIWVYRQTRDSSDWKFLSLIVASQPWFIDTGYSDGATFIPNDLNHGDERNRCGLIGDYDRSWITPPGGFSVSIDTFTSADSGIGLSNPPSGRCCQMLGYSIIFLDSAGRWSWMSTPSMERRPDSGNVNYKATLTNIPVDDSSGSCRYKILVRDSRCLPTVGADSGAWHEVYLSVIDTLSCSTSTYTDTIHILDRDDAASLMSANYPCTNFSLDSNGGMADIHQRYWDGDCVDDSLIDFKPISLVIHGDRAFIVGDKDYPNRLFYSEFGRATTYAPSKILNIASQKGDWITGLISIGGNLLIFRHQSIWALSGLSFYQYVLNEIVGDIGLTARQTLQSYKNTVYFAHQTGLYSLTGALQFSGNPLSVPIQATIDSVGPRIQRSIGRIVDGEYWWSVSSTGTENNQTLIYATTPVPHWKVYDFAFRDIVPYDYDTAQLDFRSDKYIFATVGDSLYRWGYNETDSLDDTTHIIAKYQSKYFFDDNIREKIHYVDLKGTGTVGTLTLTFYRNMGDGKPGVAFKTVTVTPDFSDRIRDRVIVNAICENFSIEISDDGVGDYTLRGYTIGYEPWDGGKL